jgi:hypothetical protein
MGGCYDRRPEFAEEAHRQSHAASTGEQAVDEQAFVDSISIWPEELRWPKSGPLLALVTTPGHLVQP